MILVVSYDFKTIKDRTSFYDALKQQGSWWHYLSSTWLISTTKSAQQVSEAIQPLLNSEDLLLVTEMGSNYHGRLPAPAWEWIQTQRHQPSLLDLVRQQQTHTSPPDGMKILADLLRDKK